MLDCEWSYVRLYFHQFWWKVNLGQYSDISSKTPLAWLLASSLLSSWLSPVGSPNPERTDVDADLAESLREESMADIILEGAAADAGVVSWLAVGEVDWW